MAARRSVAATAWAARVSAWYGRGGRESRARCAWCTPPRRVRRAHRFFASAVARMQSGAGRLPGPGFHPGYAAAAACFVGCAARTGLSAYGGA
ncbi:hypothetical protein PSMEN_06790 [Ectopseudomonas mendocina]|nr:hypothetical protein PSMEN_06790 [Pseudomonas mendocina]